MVIEKLKALIEETAPPEVSEQTIEISRLADLLMTVEGGDPCRIKTVAALIAFVADAESPSGIARELLKQTAISTE